MKYCYYCGTELNDDDVFCMNCGKAQDIEGSIGSEQTERIESLDDIVSYGYIDMERKWIKKEYEKELELELGLGY